MAVLSDREKTNKGAVPTWYAQNSDVLAMSSSKRVNLIDVTNGSATIQRITEGAEHFACKSLSLSLSFPPTAERAGLKKARQTRSGDVNVHPPGSQHHHHGRQHGNDLSAEAAGQGLAQNPLTVVLSIVQFLRARPRSEGRSLFRIRRLKVASVPPIPFMHRRQM